MGPNGSENVKTLLLLQITANNFQTKVLSWIFFPMVLKNTLGIFEILSLRFLTGFFFQKYQILHYSLWTNKTKPQLIGKRAIVEQNGMKFRTHG